jgi:hypothetical protein
MVEAACFPPSDSVYDPCTNVDRICHFQRFWRFQKSVSFVFSGR